MMVAILRRRTRIWQCAALVGVVCVIGAFSQPFQPATILDAMDAALYLNRMKAACEAAGFANALGNPDFNGTVFAPVDLGFDDALKAMNATLSQMEAEHNGTLFAIVGLHIVPGPKYFPLSNMATGNTMTTLSGNALTLGLDVPGIVHVYGADPQTDPLNFATVLQYQEIRGGKAVLYVIDRVLIPPATAATAGAARILSQP